MPKREEVYKFYKPYELIFSISFAFSTIKVYFCHKLLLTIGI